MGAGSTVSWITKGSLGSKTPELRDDRVGGEGNRGPPHLSLGVKVAGGMEFLV